MSMDILATESHALKLCEKRATLLASNIANSATPQFKAIDFDFAAAFKHANSLVSAIATTHAAHIPVAQHSPEAKIQYRVPMQFSSDENTVDDELERKSFSENALMYQAGVNIAQNKIHALLHALKGD